MALSPLPALLPPAAVPLTKTPTIGSSQRVGAAAASLSCRCTLLSSPLPLVISLWLMMTTEERAQLLHPNDGTEENSEMEKALAARQRMGVDLNRT